MSGLQLGIGGGVRAVPITPAVATPAPQTISEAAFGPNVSASAPSAASALAPNDAAGIALWSGVAGVALLLVVRHSLPK